MAQIRMTPDELRTEANETRADAASYQELLQRGDARIMKLGSTWEGEAFQGFAEQWQDKRKHVEELIQLYEELGAQTDDIANVVETTDQEIRSRIGY
ncbi:WXG100 family type VII secretion target [Siminovitchia fortis]|uniref:ESAT-6-like protein n=1 Tax=Siminovitchia fortis TaxID=254758 RepID=A0A443J0N9_9BACI|nr:WXG100 family type VII secretion target [Siminovitchia fortis]RWR13932.1 WXG100 family type VII secretion target [Siminovitchia fortis]WHY81219.1 WXG100 family type VII secretion target [Siminovitchia fortis]